MICATTNTPGGRAAEPDRVSVATSRAVPQGEDSRIRGQKWSAHRTGEGEIRGSNSTHNWKFRWDTSTTFMLPRQEFCAEQGVTLGVAVDSVDDVDEFLVVFGDDVDECLELKLI